MLTSQILEQLEHFVEHLTMAIPAWAVREMEDAVMARLRACGTFQDLLRVHAHVFLLALSQSSYVATQIIQVCTAHGCTAHAAQVFAQVRDPNTFLYNAMIKAYSQSHQHREAIALYQRMLRWPPWPRNGFMCGDRFTFPFLLKSCGGLSAPALGKQVHAHVVKSGCASNGIVQNSLTEMYARCFDLVLARKMFDEMRDKDVVSWNTLVSAHARLGQMRRARKLFNSMPNKTIVSWTALLSGYTAAGAFSDAVEVFRLMQMEGFEPDDVSIVAVLPACAHLGALELGRWIHAYCGKHRMLHKTNVRNALMEMYAKCGCIDQAMQLFDGMPDKDVVSWSTVIGGLAAHGRAHEAVSLFAQMEREQIVTPNGITFVGLLSACSHAGLLDEGLRYFDRMRDVYIIEPSIEHYGCMVDLLGRSGHIGRALEFIRDMPMAADAKIWGALLSACRSRGAVDTAALAAEHLAELKPDDVGNYVMLANTYAGAGRWGDVAGTRKEIRSRSMKKTPGCSLVEVDNVVQEFAAGEDLKPQFGGVVSMLDLLTSHIADDGMFPSGESLYLIDSDCDVDMFS